MPRQSIIRHLLAVALQLALIADVSVAQVRGRAGASDRGAGSATRGRGPVSDNRIQTRSYRMPETGTPLTYDLFVSTRADAKAKAPLIIYLHGRNAPASMHMPLLLDEAQKRGYIIAGPIGYVLEGWYGVNRGTVSELSEKDVMYVLAEVRKDFNIDEHRIYLLGESMGGAGVFHLGPKYNDIWAALAAGAPAVRGTQSPAILATIAKMPILLIHGDADQAVNVEVSRTWAEKMKALGMPYEYHELKGGTHGDVIGRGVKWIFDFFDKHPKV